MNSTVSDSNNSKSKSRFLSYFLAIFVGVLFLAALAYYLLHINPLPKDEELIAHFKAHRGEIEELVRRYRQYEPENPGMHHLWKEQGDTPKLFKQAELLYLDYIGVDWLPDPYSEATTKRREAMFKEYGYAIRYKYGAIGIRLADHRYDTVSLLYGNSIYKDLMFIPEIPRIKNNVLIQPGLDEAEQLKHPMFTRVLPSLNDYPPELHKGYCVLRQIEPQWFINMCRV